MAWGSSPTYTRGVDNGFTVTINQEVEILYAWDAVGGFFPNSFSVSYADGYTYVYFYPSIMDNSLESIHDQYFRISTSKGEAWVYFTIIDGNYYTDELWRRYIDAALLEDYDSQDHTPGKWILGDNGEQELIPAYVESHPEEFENSSSSGNESSTPITPTPNTPNDPVLGNEQADINIEKEESSSKTRTYSYPPAPASVKSGDIVVPYHEKEDAPAESNVSSDGAQDTTVVEPEPANPKQDVKEDDDVNTDSAPASGKLVLPIAGGVIGITAVTSLILFFAKKKKKGNIREKEE